MPSFLDRWLRRRGAKTQEAPDSCRASDTQRFAHPYAVAGGAKQGSGPHTRSKVSRAKAARKRARASRQKNRR